MKQRFKPIINALITFPFIFGIFAASFEISVKVSLIVAAVCVGLVGAFVVFNWWASANWPRWETLDKQPPSRKIYGNNSRRNSPRQKKRPYSYR